MSKKHIKKALVTGAGGFVGGHLVTRLKEEGYWVRGVDIKKNEFKKSAADEFLLLDLRVLKNAKKALSVEGGFDEVYSLAADRGGAGYMTPGAADMMYNNALINLYMVTEVAKLKKKPLYFFSSSVCVYQDMLEGDEEITEDGAYPALPENEYGWEKLYSERLLQTFGKKYGFPVRIARFHTTYGPYANWEGGREKAADALCRKAAMAKDAAHIEVWGDGKAIRVFTYIDDLIDGIRTLVQSDIDQPTNLGSDEKVTVEELAKTVIRVSGKNLSIKYVDGPVGVQARYFSNKRIHSTGWKHNYSLEDGLKAHYTWIKERVDKKYPS